MARRLSSVVCLAVVAVLAVVAPHPCAAQTTPSSSAGCTASILSLAPCLSFTTGSSSAPPSSACCSALASVVRGSPRCLCAVLGGGAAASLGITVNATRALELPGQCKVQTPPVSQCNDAAGATPGSASPPAPAPIVEAPMAPPPADYSTAGAGSKQQAAPATGAVSSRARRQ